MRHFMSGHQFPNGYVNILPAFHSSLLKADQEMRFARAMNG